MSAQILKITKKKKNEKKKQKCELSLLSSTEIVGKILNSSFMGCFMIKKQQQKSVID